MRLDPSAYIKDPDAVKNYKADLSDWLADGDTITGHEILTEGVTVDSDEHDDTSVTVWLSGGTAGDDVGVTVRVTTAQGVIDDGTWTFYIHEQ